MSEALTKKTFRATYSLSDPSTEVYVGDCRQVLRSFTEHSVDLVFANPPFNLGVDYGKWQDDLARHEYESFTREWIDECLRVLAPHGGEALHQRPGVVDAGGGGQRGLGLGQHGGQSIVTPVARTTADHRSISART